MESLANNNALDHDGCDPYTAAETEAISQLTAELFCNDNLKPLYLAAIRDDDIGADKLYEQLRYDIRSLGLFLKAEDRALCKFAEALQDEAISDGIARAIVAHAQECIRRQGAPNEDPEVKPPPSPNEHDPATPPPAPPPTHHPTLTLSPRTTNLLLALGAYTTLAPTLLARILSHPRSISLSSHLLDSLFSAYALRLLTAIGPTALDENGNPLCGSRLQTVVDELARTPPHKVEYAAWGTREAEVEWVWREGVAAKPGVSQWWKKEEEKEETKEVKVKAPVLREGWARVMWTSREGFVRFLDVPAGRVGGVVEGVYRGAPGVGGFVVRG